MATHEKTLKLEWIGHTGLRSILSTIEPRVAEL